MEEAEEKRDWCGPRVIPAPRGHKFESKTFPTTFPCEHCGQLIWGVMSSAVSCSECHFACHTSCKDDVAKPCKVLADAHEGMPHTFEVMSILLTKPTYCNCCRGLLLSMIGKPGRLCSVCKYLIHEECLNKAENNCAITSDLYIEKGEGMTHNWVEGNLYLGTCAHCSETIGLGGMINFRCSWCAREVHSTCRPKYKESCDFGEFGPLIIPPYAIASYKEGDKTRWKVLPDMLPSEQRPLIVFINKRSGGQQGEQVITALLGLINPLQIFDLGHGGPAPGLEAMRPLIDAGRSFYILGCGGDGTIGWICAALDKANFPKDRIPSIAVLPLGTGNDMARTLGWGRGYNGEDMGGILRDVMKAETIWLDRWAVTITPLSTEDKKEKEGEEKQVKHSISNNYFSIGIDAKVALDFHLARQASPESFKSRKMNKIKYFGYGTSAVFDGTCKDLTSKISLQVDDKEIELPKGMEGLIVLNLPSYAGGSNLWGKSDEDKFSVPSLQDELLEVVAVTGSLHLATIKTRTSSAIQLAQGKHIKIVLMADMPTQIDGEPWLQKPAVFEVTHHNQVRMLKSKTAHTFPADDMPIMSDDPSEWILMVPSPKNE